MDAIETWHSAYLGNLPRDVTEAEVREWLKSFGPLSVFVQKPDAPFPYTYGFARFASKEQRNRLVAALDGSMFGNKTVTVEVAASPSGRSSTARGARKQKTIQPLPVHSTQQQQQQHVEADGRGDRAKMQFVLQCYAELKEQRRLKEKQQEEQRLQQLLLHEGQEHQPATAAEGAVAAHITDAELVKLILRTPYGLCTVSDDIPVSRVLPVNTERIRQHLQALGFVRHREPLLDSSPATAFCWQACSSKSPHESGPEGDPPEAACDVPFVWQQQRQCNPEKDTPGAACDAPFVWQQQRESNPKKDTPEAACDVPFVWQQQRESKPMTDTPEAACDLPFLRQQQRESKPMKNTPEAACDLPFLRQQQREQFYQSTVSPVAGGRGRPMALKDAVEAALPCGRGRFPMSLI